MHRKAVPHVLVSQCAMSARLFAVACMQTELLASAVIGQAPGFEAEPLVLQASEILAADIRVGDHHTVAEEVLNDGYLNSYRIDSSYGLFEAHGSPELRIRIAEIEALAELDRVSKTEVFLSALGRSATSQLEVIKDIADKPIATVKGIPRGVGRMFRRYKWDVEEGVETANEILGTDDGEADDAAAPQAEAKTKEEESLADRGLEAAGGYSKRYFGLNRSERYWYQQLGVDPYTDNETLKAAVRSIAKVDASAGFGMRFVPLPRIPGVNYLSDVQEAVYNLDPRELRRLNAKRLRDMGTGEEVIESFLDHPVLRPSQQSVFVSVLSALEGVPGRPAVIEQATAVVASPTQASFLTSTIAMVSLFQDTEGGIERLIAAGSVPSVVTTNGRLVVFAAVDHLAWVESLRDAFDSLHHLADLVDADGKEIWLLGGVSSRCRNELESRGWIVRSDIPIPESP